MTKKTTLNPKWSFITQKNSFVVSKIGTFVFEMRAICAEIHFEKHQNVYSYPLYLILWHQKSVLPFKALNHSFLIETKNFSYRTFSCFLVYTRPF